MADSDEEAPLLAKSQVAPRSCAIHLRLIVIALSSLLAFGVLTGYPTIEPLLAAQGVFDGHCPAVNQTRATLADSFAGRPGRCRAQQLALQNLYNVAWGITAGGAIVTGIVYDRAGARLSGVIGSVGSAIGIIPIWAGLNWPEQASWLLYIGFSVAQFFGQLSSYSILGMLWHYPTNQAFIIGLSQAMFQLRGLAAYAVLGLNNIGFTIQWTFLVMAGLNIASAVVSWFAVPTPREYYDNAKAALQVDITPDLSGSILKIVRDTVNVMWKRKGGALVGVFGVGAPFLLVIYWSSVYADYMLFVVTPDQANILRLLYTIAMCAIGGVVLPVLGVLLDKMGMFWFYVGLSISLGGFLGTLFIHNLVAQIVSLFFGVVFMASWGTYVQTWAVFFAPFVLLGIRASRPSLTMFHVCRPQLLGAYMGVVFGILGAFTLPVTIAIPNALEQVLSGFPLYAWPLAIMGGVGGACAIVVLVYIGKFGVPESPPEPTDDWNNTPAAAIN